MSAGGMFMAGGGMSALGGVMGGIQGYQNSKYQAKVAEAEAKSILGAAQFEADNIADRARRLKGIQVASMARGAGLGSRTLLAVLEDTASQTAREQQANLYNAQVGATRARNQAAQYDNAALGYLGSGMMNGAGSLLSSAGQYERFYKD